MAATKAAGQAAMNEGDEAWLWQKATEMAHHLQCEVAPSAPSSIRQRFPGRGALEQELLRRMALLCGVKAAD